MLTATFLPYEKELEANIDHVFYLEPKLSLYVGVFSNSPYHDFGCIYLADALKRAPKNRARHHEVQN